MEVVIILSAMLFSLFVHCLAEIDAVALIRAFLGFPVFRALYFSLFSIDTPYLVTRTLAISFFLTSSRVMRVCYDNDGTWRRNLDIVVGNWA